MATAPWWSEPPVPQSTTYNPNATGVANNLTLTVLDISNPRDPQILGSTFVTNEQFPVNEAGAKTDVVSLGNGDFAVSDTDAGGKPALLVVDPSNPSYIVVSAAQVPSGVHGITVSGDTLYASTSSGLSIYQIGQLVSDPVTITATLPPGTAATIPASSFNIPPTQISTGTTADTLTWDRSFSAGDTSFTFTWQGSVSGVQTGQSTPVTQGATISYVAQSTPGTLDLPGTTVTGTSIISLTPSIAHRAAGRQRDLRCAALQSHQRGRNLRRYLPHPAGQYPAPGHYRAHGSGRQQRGFPLVLTSYHIGPGWNVPFHRHRRLRSLRLKLLDSAWRVQGFRQSAPWSSRGRQSFSPILMLRAWWYP